MRTSTRPSPPILWSLLALCGCAGADPAATAPAPASVPPGLGAMTAGAAPPEGNNLLANATFDEGTMLPWTWRT